MPLPSRRGCNCAVGDEGSGGWLLALAFAAAIWRTRTAGRRSRRR
jgi:MYXO-CTERM domain-containing protein